MVTRSTRASERGQSLVEFALIVPLLFFLTVAIADFGRVFMTAIGVESAAREAADYGAFRTAAAWKNSDAPFTANFAEMARRTCTSLSSLPGYQGNPGNTDCGVAGVPYYTFEVIKPAGVADCGDQELATETPCIIHATVTFPFSTIIQFPGIPTGITFTRESYFAVSDF